jgi:hypothetical protein
VPWEVHWGGIGNPHGGLEGKLTKCRLGQTIFYVRENVAPLGGHFQVSAGERMGWKQGRLSRRHLQVLELAAPAADWQRIAQIVHDADALKRPVRHNRLFTSAWVHKRLCELDPALYRVKGDVCPSKPTLA